MSEEVLEQEWPVRLAVLRQDLEVEQDRSVRHQSAAAALRKKASQLGMEMAEVKAANERLVHEVSDVKSREGNGGGSDTFKTLRGEIKDLKDKLAVSVAAQAKVSH